MKYRITSGIDDHNKTVKEGDIYSLVVEHPWKSEQVRPVVEKYLEDNTREWDVRIQPRLHLVRVSAPRPIEPGKFAVTTKLVQRLEVVGPIGLLQDVYGVLNENGCFLEKQEYAGMKEDDPFAIDTSRFRVVIRNENAALSLLCECGNCFQPNAKYYFRQESEEQFVDGDPAAPIALCADHAEGRIPFPVG